MTYRTRWCPISKLRDTTNEENVLVGVPYVKTASTVNKHVAYLPISRCCSLLERDSYGGICW